MLIKISLSLDPGGAGRIQGVSLQLCIEQTTVSFPIADPIAAVATTTATLSLANKSIVQRQNAFFREVTASHS